MNRRLLPVLLLVFAALGAVALLQTSRPTTLPSPAQPDVLATAARATGEAAGIPEYQRVYPDMAVLDIQAIRLSRPGVEGAFTISRAEDGTWTAPELENDEVRLDAETASTIAKTIVLLYYERSLALTDSTNLADYGFDPNGILFIEVLLRSGEGHIIAIGTLSGSRNAYYALVDDRQEIILLERGPVDYLLTQYVNPPLT